MTTSPALQRTLDALPTSPGVYLWKGASGEVLYVGKARNLRSRVRSYLGADPGVSPKDVLLRRLIRDVDTIVVENEAESLLLENNLIKEYQPRFNIRLKDDKSYPSIAVTVGEPFPRVLVTRRRDLPGATYFGPFTDVTDMRRALATVRRLFTVRSCSDDLPRQMRDRPCLDYYIGRCKAPCVGRQSEDHYRVMIDEVLSFLAGDTGDVRGRIRDLMLEASERTAYERARDLRDTLKWLEQIESPPAVEVTGSGNADVIGFARDGDDAVGLLLRVREGKVVSREHRFLENVEPESSNDILQAFLVRYYLPSEHRALRTVLPFHPSDSEMIEQMLAPGRLLVPHRGRASRWAALADQNAQHLLESLRLESFDVEERAEDPVYALGRELGLTSVPRSLVCVDISTHQGRDTVGSLVWFEGGRPRKGEYRRFTIKGPGQQDDYAAIEEVMTRYLSRRKESGDPIPDLFVIDGGKGQLGAALGATKALGFEALPVIGLAKRDEEIFLPGRKEPLRLSRRHPALRLLQRARDEAHRFGLAFSRHRQTRRVISSGIMEIPGIGPNRRRALLERFGSLAGVRSATPSELATVPGISTGLAHRIHTYLSETR
jgi:excinuclease ABC subunit C